MQSFVNCTSIRFFTYFKYIFLAIYLVSLFFLTNWFGLDERTAIDLDELAWVNDAQVFDWRKNGHWGNFTWSDNTLNAWMSHDFRLFDQPHLVKYIFGSIFSHQNTKPWSDQYYHQKNYSQFVEHSISGVHFLHDDASKDIFGKNTIQAIILGRKVSSFFGVLFVILISFFLAKEFSVFQSVVVSFLVLTNPIFQYNLNLATADSVSVFLMLVSLMCLYFLYKRKKYKKIFFFFSSITAALAASSKINGWIVPMLFIFVSLVEGKNNFKQTAKLILMWVGLYLGVYLYLQPELWARPIEGVSRYLSQRVMQQLRFEANGYLNFFEYHRWLLHLFVKSNNEMTELLKVGIFFAGIGTFIFKVVKKYVEISSRSYLKKLRKFIKANLTEKNFQYLLIFVMVWLAIFFYAKVGFERYAIWPLLTTFIVFAFFLERSLYGFYKDD